MTTVEICTEDADGAAAAQAGGADRIELCAALSEGGITPTLGMVEHARRSAPGLDIQVLIRPRGGDFVYSPAELAIMQADVRAVREQLSDAAGGVLGFTLGALTADGRVDVAAMTALVTACGPAPVTFHKAFDAVADKKDALRLLSHLGVSTVLTAGGQGSASDNLPVLAELVRHAGEHLTIMVGGSVRAENAASIIRATGASAIHLRAGRDLPSSSRTGRTQYDDGIREVTSAEVVADVVAAVGAKDAG